MTTPALSPRVERDIIAVVQPLVNAMRDCARSNPDFTFTGSGEIVVDSQVYGVTVSIAPRDELNVYTLTAAFSCKSTLDTPVPFLENNPLEVLTQRLAELVTSPDDGRDGWVVDTNRYIFEAASGTIGLIVTAPAR